MRRGMILPTLAAATVVGHLGYHLLTLRCKCGSRQEAGLVEAATVMAPPAAPAPCVARAPIGPADWQPMAAALRLHLHVHERIEPGGEHFARGTQMLVQRLEACQVQLDGDLTDLHARTAMGGTWFGAHFRKNDAGWSVFRLDGGDIR
jgi:hypothetical protein